MYRKFVEFLELRKIPLDDLSLEQWRDHVAVVTKWNWDYNQALNFQKVCLEFVKERPQFQVLIFCNHPCVYTLGRGLQKKGGKVLDDLVEFNSELINDLSFPVFNINRGGGITYHHPGQFIIYPIVNLNLPNWNLKAHFHWLLESVAEGLKELPGLQQAKADLCHAGVWLEKKKLASIGVGVERFVTFHGLALNLFQESKMISDLQRIHPCGLGPEVMSSVDQITELEPSYIQKFQSLLMQLPRFAQLGPF